MPVFNSLFGFFRLRDIPHYYGDYVRQLFVLAALLVVVAIPLWGDLLSVGTTAEIGGALLLVLLAGLTSPSGTIVMLCNVIVAGLGALVLESAAITNYSLQSSALFVAREVCAILLLFAFYFGVKTLRAMLSGKIGKWGNEGEFGR